MRSTLIQSAKAFVVILVVALFAFTNYSCRQQPSSSSNNTTRTTATTSTPDTSPPPTVPAWPQGFPPGFPAATLSGNIPLVVTLPASAQSPEQVRPYFDYFSWQSFIALNWPAATAGTRGTPDQPGNPAVFLKAAGGTPVVWGAYKDSFDLFGQQQERPSAWDASASPVAACRDAAPGQKTLIFLTKGDTPLMQTTQAFSAPLVDQRGNYVYYDVRYDEAQYNFIRGADADPASWLYLIKNLAPKEPVQMPASAPPSTLGAIMVKAAWRIKTDRDNPARYYTTSALVFNPQTKACTPTPVLLVGLHIAHKVAPFTEWVWSTFEQVDNVPPDTAATTATTAQSSSSPSSSPSASPSPSSPSPSLTPPSGGYSFNNGTDTPKTVGGYDHKPPPPSNQPAVPVQVTRLNPIPATPSGASTREVNAFYQQLLAGTVWQYYQLVITQWPSDPGTSVTMEQGGIYPRDAGGAFPVNGAVNTTMETYFQSPNDAAGAGGNSCMSCHYRAGQSDFSWGLNRRAH